MSIQKYGVALMLGCSTLLAANKAKAQVVTEVKTVKEANVKVFVTEYAMDADVVVFKTPFIKNAYGNKGIWYFTSVNGEANKRICFVPSKQLANIVICYTTDSKQAGWKNKRKQHFMD